MPDRESLHLLTEALDRLQQGFEDLPVVEAAVDFSEMRTVLLQAAERMQDNFPYMHPLYAGQMLKPPHAVARLAYTLAMYINPNNHALDGGRASSEMEKEVIAQLAAMFEWPEYLGHLCSGGTMANLEALWVAGRLQPGKAIVASEQAHYTHRRISDVLKLPFRTIPCDDQARLDPGLLEKELKKGDIGTVVATIGTTGTGSVDPLSELLKLKDQYGFRLHADAAYGGYFILTDNLMADTTGHISGLTGVDSIVIDPHKHGLQPYGAGCILFRDPVVGRFYKHDSPYTYFSSDELHLGEISLECSRPGAAAVALWTTLQLLPLVRGGRFARMLADCRHAAVELFRRLDGDERFLTFFPPELDIVVWAPRGESSGEISQRSRTIFQHAADHQLHLALFKYPVDRLKDRWSAVDFDGDTVTCLRSCLMKPDHLVWMDRIWQIIDRVS